MYLTDDKTKKAILILTHNHLSMTSHNNKKTKALKDIEKEELENLVKTCFLIPVFTFCFNLQKPSSATFIGIGQLEKIASAVADYEADLVIFNDDITARVQRNLERILNTCVIDRCQVIIQIFSDRAKTREAFLQAQLAQAEYSMPRLTHRWTNLAQQRGSAKGANGASRGSGEKKLELDKRKLKADIAKLKKEVEKVRLQRKVQRKSRMLGDKKVGAIVGYTNAGKSSLLKKLSDSSILAEDKLFATVDSKTCKVFFKIDEKEVQFLLTDTVGFVSKLPHQLIDAFRSTLEEAVIADFLIIMCDASHPAMLECFNVTLSVLDELNCLNKPSIIVINKCDTVFDKMQILNLKEKYPTSIELSLKTGEGLDELKKQLSLI